MNIRKDLCQTGWMLTIFAGTVLAATQTISKPYHTRRMLGAVSPALLGAIGNGIVMVDSHENGDEKGLI